MNRIPFGSSGETISEVAIGCMRIGGLPPADLDQLVTTALDCGIDFFDHADIYGGGKCEEVFRDSVRRLGIPRDKMFLQSKCGIRKGFFDFSKEYIVSSTEQILQRLGIDTLDSLLLHRPDALMEPGEVAEAFHTLHTRGLVRFFGVSNFNPAQIRLLQSATGHRLHANQLQLSLAHTGMMDQGLTVNMKHQNSVDRDGSVLDFCQLEKITVQAWSPFQYGFFEGVFIDSDQYPELNAVMDRLSEQYGVTKTGLAIAWIQRHPAKIQSVLGTTSPERVKQVAEACEIRLTRPEWYELYRAAGNILP
jgi:predicted oxidoreductase